MRREQGDRGERRAGEDTEEHGEKRGRQREKERRLTETVSRMIRGCRDQEEPMRSKELDDKLVQGSGRTNEKQGAG